MSIILDGRPVSRAILDDAREDIAAFVKQDNDLPGLAVLYAGSDGGAASYLRSIRRTFDSVGIDTLAVELPDDVSEDEFRHAADLLNRDPLIAGIIALQPLPSQLPADIASDSIDPAKDVDGITEQNAGRLALGQPGLRPSTPAGGIEILRHYGIETEGQRAVVIGRSSVVGKPMALLLLAANATVTICHSRTSDLALHTRHADIVACATGRPGILTADMIRPGATVIDFGVNVVDGKIVGDAAQDVAEVAGAITPVPRGTGLVTTAVLVRNTLSAARAQRGLPRPVPIESQS